MGGNRHFALECNDCGARLGGLRTFVSDDERRQGFRTEADAQALGWTRTPTPGARDRDRIDHCPTCSVERLTPLTRAALGTAFMAVNPTLWPAGRHALEVLVTWDEPAVTTAVRQVLMRDGDQLEANAGVDPTSSTAGTDNRSSWFHLVRFPDAQVVIRCSSDVRWGATGVHPDYVITIGEISHRTGRELEAARRRDHGWGITTAERITGADLPTVGP